MSGRIDTIVHIGAGRCGEADEFRATGARRIVLIEPDPKSAGFLREMFSDEEGVRIYEKAVAASKGSGELRLFNVRRYSSLHEPTALSELYPGLRKTGELYPDMWTPRQMFEELGIDGREKNWLVVDAPGEEGAILESLRDKGLLTSFERVSVYASDTVLYKGGRGAEEILSLLDELGWEPVEDNDESDGERPRHTLERDSKRIENLELKKKIEQLEAEAQKKQEQFSALQQERDELREKSKSQEKKISELDATRQKYEGQIKKQTERFEQLKAEAGEKNKRIEQLEAEAKKKREQFSELERERDGLKERAEKSEAKAAELERLKSEIGERDKRIELLQDQLSVSLKLQKAREGDLKELQTKFEKIDGRISKEIASIRNALNKEKADRIHSFAYRDSQGNIPGKYLILLTLHRSGSTYMMDALRTHPEIYIEPRAFLQEHLSLVAGRYPLDLTDKGIGPFLDIEQSPGRGVKVPVLGSLQKPGPLNCQISDKSVAIEKIHSEFYHFDTKKFISELNHLKNENKTDFKFIYQMRDPKSVISSLIKYKKRNPDWYKHVKEDDIPQFVYREHSSLKEFIENYHEGIIIDYEDLIHNFKNTLMKIFKFLWPENKVLSRYYEDIIQRARQFTDRDKRMEYQSSPFLGKQPGTIKGGDSDLQKYFDKHHAEIEKCYHIYNELLESRQEQTLGKDL